MCKQLLLTIFLVFITTVLGKKRYTIINSDENDIIKKSIVTLSFSTYALKIPPRVMSRSALGSSVDLSEVPCNSKSVTKAMFELRKQTQCVPREILVEISAPNNLTVDPNVVVVKRCGGLCKGNKQCTSVGNEKLVEFFVTSKNIKTQMTYCNRIEVIEHTKCKCTCEKKCKLPQRLNPNTCKCGCTNIRDIEDCDNMDGNRFRWDNKTCSCKCKHIKPCTTGTQWDAQQCRCVKS